MPINRRQKIFRNDLQYTFVHTRTYSPAPYAEALRSIVHKNGVRRDTGDLYCHVRMLPCKTTPCLFECPNHVCAPKEGLNCPSMTIHSVSPHRMTTPIVNHLQHYYYYYGENRKETTSPFNLCPFDLWQP